MATQLPTLHTLLGECLEVCIHELLYIRNVYSREIFETTRYLGVKCHCISCNESDLCSYINEFLRVACSGLCCGAANKVSFLVLDSSRGQGRNSSEQLPVEKYVFEVDLYHLLSDEQLGSDQEKMGQSNTTSIFVPESHSWNVAMMRQLERGFRNLFLRILAMDTDGKGGAGSHLTTARHGVSFQKPCRLSSRATFKLQLHTIGRETNVGLSKTENDDFEENSHNNILHDKFKACRELDEVMQDGKWCHSEDKAPLEVSSQSFCDHNGEKSDVINTLPLKSINVPSCGLRIQLLMENI
uniref:HORMA domain-containing protein n=1 Tax=Proboscia inermis TaxID=420281 RepID=A0A7S0BWN5_9STRA|mmetsp:Transcript_41927/g.50284  ORF Transcript_41927/g.50284 Transcript_41927/m.50284 type:complete len:298 (-) Transcript_41927:43-936(-)